MIAHRLATPDLELDLLVTWSDGCTLVEVKTGRAAGGFRPADHLDRERADRLLAAARRLERELRAPCRAELCEILVGAGWPRLRRVPVSRARPPGIPGPSPIGPGRPGSTGPTGDP